MNMEREAEHQREMEVGAFLRAHRLRSGLTLSQASDALCIREAYLKAIEDGRFHDLPGPTYVFGFIRTYAEHLGLDGAEVVHQFKAKPLNRDGQSELRFPSPMSEGGMPTGAILLLGFVIALVAYGAWYFSSTRDGGVAELISPLPERLVAFLRDGGGASDGEGAVDQASRAAPAGEKQTDHVESAPQSEAAPSATPDAADQRDAASPMEAEGDSVATSSVPERKDVGDAAEGPDSQTKIIEGSANDSEAGAAEPQAVAVPQVSSREPDEQETSGGMAGTNQPASAESASASEARIVLVAKGENWIEVREQGTDRQVVARLLKPGDTYHVPDTPGLKLLTGNAGGLEIYVDGELVPSIGGEGMVRRNIPLQADQLRSGAWARN